MAIDWPWERYFGSKADMFFWIVEAGMDDKRLLVRQ